MRTTLRDPKQPGGGDLLVPHVTATKVSMKRGPAENRTPVAASPTVGAK